MQLPPALWPAVHRIATGEDWPPKSISAARAFVDEARLQFLLPLLFTAADLPAEVSQLLPSCKALERLSAARSSIIGEELERLISVLDSEEIVLIKGSDYAHRLYDAPSLRPMSDIDILVPRTRLRPVDERLQASGYRRSFVGGPSWRMESAIEWVYVSDRAMVEVHHAFIQNRRTTIDYEAVWSRRVPMEGFPPGVFRLDEVDAITYHALSMAIHEFESRIVRDLDFWLLLRRDPSLLEVAAQRAVEWSCRNAFFGSLTTVAALFPDLRSERYDGVARSMASKRLRQFLTRRVLPDPHRRTWIRKPGRLTQLWRKFWMMDSTWRRIVFLLSDIWAKLAGRVLALRSRG